MEYSIKHIYPLWSSWQLSAAAYEIVGLCVWSVCVWSVCVCLECVKETKMTGSVQRGSTAEDSLCNFAEHSWKLYLEMDFYWNADRYFCAFSFSLLFAAVSSFHLKPRKLVHISQRHIASPPAVLPSSSSFIRLRPSFISSPSCLPLVH